MARDRHRDVAEAIGLDIFIMFAHSDDYNSEHLIFLKCGDASG